MSEEPRMQWISQSDTDARLRLLRYGLIVAVIAIFLITWLVPFVFLQSWTNELSNTADVARATNPDVPEVDKFQITESLGWGLLAGVVSAVVGVVIYFGYREILKRTVSEGEGEEEA